MENKRDDHSDLERTDLSRCSVLNIRSRHIRHIRNRYRHIHVFTTAPGPDPYALAERSMSNQDTLHHISEHISGMKNVKALNVEIPAIQRADAFLESIKISGIQISLLQQIASQVIPPIG